MSKIKKRNKSYNPKKLNPERVRQLQAEAAQAKEDIENSKKLYELSMEFVAEDTKRIHEELEQKAKHIIAEMRKKFVDHGFPDEPINLPYDIAVMTYQAQDLAIALVMEQVENPDLWVVGVDTHLVHETDPEAEVITNHYREDLPSMSFIELMSGSKASVDRGNGLRTRWRGLSCEVSKQIDAPEGYIVAQMQVYFSADVQFKNVDLFREFNAMLKWRDNEFIQQGLRSMWVLEYVNRLKELLEQKKVGKAA